MPPPISSRGSSSSRCRARRAAAQRVKADGADQQAHGRDGAGREAVREPRGQGRHDEDRPRQREHQPAGLGHIAPLEADEADRQQHQQHDEGVGRRAREQLHADEARIAEQRQVEHRMRDAALDRDKDDTQQHGAGQRAHHPGAAPAAVGRLQHAQGQQAQRAREAQGAGHVEAHGLRVARLAHARRGDRQRREAHERGAPHHGLPAEAFAEPAREQRARGEAGAERGADQAEGARARRTVEDLRQRGGAGGEGRGRTEPLRGAREVEPHDARRAHSEQAAQQDQQQPEHEHALAPAGIGQRAGRHQRAAEAQHEGIGDPVELNRAAAQRGMDGGQRDGRAGEAQRHADRGQADGGEQPVRAWRRGRRRRKRRRHGHPSRKTGNRAVRRRP